MQRLILSDIHGNLEAFQTVLKEAEKRGGYEEIWCLGDVVGYGPDPRECIELLRQNKHICVAGNHDWAAIGKLDMSDFNPSAAAACRWTGQRLTLEEIKYLQGLPLKLQLEDFTLVHGSPRDPIWEYIFSTEVAKINLDCFETNICLVGHTHAPIIFEYIPASGLCVSHYFPANAYIKLNGRKLIINPGAVGQPRDGNPQASYAIYDSLSNTVYHYRVYYNIALTQEKMKRHGLPPPLIERLANGW